MAVPESLQAYVRRGYASFETIEKARAALATQRRMWIVGPVASQCAMFLERLLEDYGAPSAAEDAILFAHAGAHFGCHVWRYRADFRSFSIADAGERNLVKNIGPHARWLIFDQFPNAASQLAWLREMQKKPRLGGLAVFEAGIIGADPRAVAMDAYGRMSAAIEGWGAADERALNLVLTSVDLLIVVQEHRLTPFVRDDIQSRFAVSLPHF